MCIISTSEGNKRGRRSSRGTRSRGDRTPKAIAKFVPNNTIEFAEDPDFGIIESIITIDNGDFGSRNIRFETGQLARQAGGSVTTYLDDDTMLLATTTASSQPREGFDFFPLTVDVEERMYATGRIPGSFFRREGRPSTEAIFGVPLN